MPLAILKTQASSASGLSVWRLPQPFREISDQRPRTLNSMSQYDRMGQIALYLLRWRDAAPVRFVPECVYFIFKCTDDYYRSPECQNPIDPVPGGPLPSCGY
jgi:hypothetical protein